MSRPILLDLYCCAGGAAKGYHDAGFDVIGVDVKPQPDYPYLFVQGDALEVLRGFLSSPLPIAAIHASPPCQFDTAGMRAQTKAGTNPHLNFIPATRAALQASGLPYVIENVDNVARRGHLVNPHMLCGRQFGLGATDTDGTELVLDRHRWFETNWGLCVPMHQKHDKSVQVAGVYGGARKDKVEARTIRKGGYVPADVGVQQKLLGIEWTKNKSRLKEAIPPIFTTYIGVQLRDVLERSA